MKNKKTNEKPYFICKGCMDAIRRSRESKEKGYCIYCYKEREAIRNNRCIKCSGQNPIKEYWGRCQKCWDDEEKEIDAENKKLFDNGL